MFTKLKNINVVFLWLLSWSAVSLVELHQQKTVRNNVNLLSGYLTGLSLVSVCMLIWKRWSVDLVFVVISQRSTCCSHNIQTLASSSSRFLPVIPQDDQKVQTFLSYGFYIITIDVALNAQPSLRCLHTGHMCGTVRHMEHNIVTSCWT